MRALPLSVYQHPPRPRFASAPVMVAIHMLLAGWSGSIAFTPAPVAAQGVPRDAAPDSAVVLKPSGELQETLPLDARDRVPTFVSGERVTGQTDGVVTIEGGAELRRHDTVIRADRLEFDQRTSEASATGNVLINRYGNRFEGPSLQLNVETNQGRFEQPAFSLLESEGHGDASRVDLLGDDKLTAYDARYSTCPRTPGAKWMPDWLIRASRIDLDNAAQQGTAVGGVLEFKGVPILGAPYLSFPLSDARKSGVLPPTINLDNVSGLEITLPYYLNLAPNLDATLYPTLMSKRGVDLGGELRYLQPNWDGQLRAAYMPSDQLRADNRWGYSAQHNHSFAGAPGLRWLGMDGTLDARLNLNRVSDDNYWRDFPRTSTSLTTRLLASEGVLSWGQGPWSFSAGAYRWQTLQDVDAPITPPYDRLPSLAARYVLNDFSIAGVRDWDASVLAEYTRFRADASLTGQPNGSRAVAVAEISRRWERPGGYVKPRFQLHTTQYRFDTPLVNGALSASRILPTFSVDSGLVFEREASYFGRGFTQTLEPRAFFTHTPFRDQSRLPNYDSAANDFNFASIYTENAFGGQDRISDTRALTLGATSRLLDPRTGAEVVRLGLAQRIRLSDQEVVLPNAAGLPGGDPVRERLSDVLLGARVQWDPRWQVDANVQFNPKDRESVRTTLGARYTPSNFRVLSAAYRLQRGVSEQVDVGWQWPLGDLMGTPAPRTGVPGRGLGAGQWYSVGRINYSVPDSKVVDLVAGFEYDAGCWIGRVVLERLAVGTASANQRVLFQLEFSGFSRIGSNPLQSLKDNVPRYQYLREQINPPSRFQQYD
ncbi:LPS-assembly protein LptD [Hydrogenophaga sp.]|uniref:LPS-assembly protein LptD n=1 Tax=Hydrogenophaga sp. TaxID=1904254 RepID=UPI002613C522|nr:LPS-assembly protein LptD [Hydrogenophaga sp.]MDM7949076.1 LPS-assembly protein LptD [Hydrogenophaga sp.]